MRNQARVAGRSHSAAAKQSPPMFKSDFALLDVKQGRAALEKRVRAGEKIMIRVDMEINSVWSDDDGISREFSCEVKAVKQL